MERFARRPAWGILILLVAFGLLSIAYSLATPLFEAPDEDLHFFYIKRLADGDGLPVLDPANPGPWAQEGGQPPLYYALGALLIRSIDTSGVESDLKLNPHANLGNPLQPGNKNRWIHTPAERWPWRGWVWAAHLLRFGSIVLGLGSVYLAYRLACLVFPAQPLLSLCAAALLAFLPQFLFLSASISNDNLIIFLSLLVLLLLARGLTDVRPGDQTQTPAVEQAQPRVKVSPTTRMGLALGLVLGLAALSKLSGLGLLILTAVIWLWQGWRRGRWRQEAFSLAVAGLIVLLLAGWWYLRNWRLYGDPTGLQPFLAIVGPRPEPLTLGALAAEFQGLRISLFALFGWFNLLLPAWFYRLWDIFLLLAGGGLLLFVWRRRRAALSEAHLAERAGLLLLWLLISLVSLWRWTSLTPGSQGRLLLPAFAAGSLLFVFGWSQWLPRRPAWAALPAAGALIAALVALVLVIFPAYRHPKLISADDIPPAARIDPVETDGRIRLLGIETEPATITPGQSFDVTLYWQATQPIPYDASLFLRLLGPDGQRGTTAKQSYPTAFQVFGQWDGYPGWGAYPTSLWPTGPVIVDRYQLQAPWNAPTPVLLRLDAGLYDYDSKMGYPSQLASGARPSPGLTTLRLLPEKPPQTPSIPNPTAFTFDDRVALLGYDLPGESYHPGQTLDLDLFLQATKPVGEDLQVFVHLLDAAGERVAGFDGPAGGPWWPTSAWEPAQVVVDRYPLPVPADLPPGAYTLAVGLYRLANLERIPVTGPSGQTADRLAEAALLTRIEIRP